MTTRFVLTNAGLLGTVLTATTAFSYQKVLRQQWPSELVPELENDTASQSGTSPSDVVIIGGGVVGIATAYACAQAGQTVTLVEPNAKAGQECTSCAAGGMQRSNPVVNLSTWLAVIKCSVGFGYRFFHIDFPSTLSDPFFWRWAYTFTTTSLLPPPEYEGKQKQMLKFTDYCVGQMVQFMDPQVSKASGYNPQGSLAVSYTPPATATATPPKGGKASNPTASKMNYEPNRMLTSTDEILALEPSLAFQKQPPLSAKFEYEASAASAERFTLKVAELCAKHPNIRLVYGTTVKGLRQEKASDTGATTKPYIAELQTNRGVIPIGPKAQVVVAAGAWTPHLLATCDFYAPVYPLKGYAMSLSAKEILQKSQKLQEKDLPSRIVADAFMFTSRLGDEIRITSIGEFSGWSTAPTTSVERAFRKEAARQFPQLEEYLPEATTRCGHRPYVSDGLVLLGRVDEMENLLVTCGPGSNGWKMAMGSAAVIQRLTAGETEDEVTQGLGFDVSSFSPAQRVVRAPVFAKMCRARWNF